MVTAFARAMGGCYSNLSLSSDLTLNPRFPRYIRLSPTTSGVKVLLPDVSKLQLGGPHWIISVGGPGIDDILIRTHDDVAVGTLPNASAWEMCLYEDASGDRKWIYHQTVAG